MGYTHYWYRKTEIDQGTFDRILLDFVAIQPYIEDIMRGKLAGGNGTGLPELSTDAIIFNGNEKCGHSRVELGITWPSETAKGMADGNPVAGGWFAGAKLNGRACGGDCSHETFYFPRVHKVEKGYEFMMHKDDYIFSFTKTAYKPYDLAVNVALIICKHYLGDRIYVHSDGEAKDWEDGMGLCQGKFGYGKDFTLDTFTPGDLVERPKPIAVMDNRTGEGFMVIAEVDGTENNRYQIKRHSDGVVSCECRGWKFSKKKPKTCRHIRELELYLTTNGQMGKGVHVLEQPFDGLISKILGFGQ